MQLILRLCKNNKLFVSIFLLALFLRIYRIDTLTTFGRDQGIDFLVIKDMILYHKWTLIGIKTSIGEFFQGPNYLYMLLPSFRLMNLNPLAGSYTAVFVSMLSLILLYFTVTRYSNKQSALFSSTVFAVSPYFIKFGVTPIGTAFTVTFFIAGFYFCYKIIKIQNLLLSFVLGFLSGFAMELHFLSITFAVGLFFYLLLIAKKKALLSLGFILGLIFGLLPTIIFEVRHQFLNTQLFLRFLKEYTPSSLTFQMHYLLPVLILIIILLPSYLYKVLKIKLFYLILASYLIINLLKVLPTILYSNHGYDMPEGWSLKTINEVGRIIVEDSKVLQNINVASLLDGDTRVYPLRYVLTIHGINLKSVEEYPSTNHLYIVSINKQQVTNSKVWEITTLTPYQISKDWKINEFVYLYRLDRKSSSAY